MILIKHRHQMAKDKDVHPRVATNLALLVVAQVVAAVAEAILAEMIGGVSASLVHAEHPRDKTEMVPTEERLHCVSKTREGDREGLRAADPSERGIEQPNAKRKQRPLRNVERLLCQSK